jgi:hypothetical protein
MRPLLALFVRALRQSTKAPSTYLLRGCIALTVLLLLWSAHESLSWAGAAGRRFFGMLIGANYFFVTMLGLGSFASAIAEEKEEGTLGLMRMANLSSVAILFGKSTSRLGIVFLLFMVQVPFAFLAVTLGGVSQSQILTAFILLGAFLFALANISLFFSVLLPRSSRAAVMTIGLGIGYSLACAVPFFFREWLIHKKGYSMTDPTVVTLQSVGEWLWSVHPAYHFGILSAGGFLSLEISRSVIVHICIGLAFFLFSILIFERCCGNEAAYAGEGGKGRRRLRWLGRPKRALTHAIAWKDFHFTMGGRLSVVARCALYVSGVIGLTWIFDELDDRKSVAYTAWFMGLAMCHIELAFLALLAWGPEAWGQHIGSLVMTPRGLRRINFEKLKAALLAILPSFSLLVLAMAIGGSKFIDDVLIEPFTQRYRGPGGMPINFWYMIRITQWLLEFGVLLALIVNLSLRLKWTALPAALGIFVLFQIVTSIATASLYGFGRMGSFGSTYMISAATASVTALAVIYFVARNTRTVLLRRAAEG